MEQVLKNKRKFFHTCMAVVIVMTFVALLLLPKPMQSLNSRTWERLRLRVSSIDRQQSEKAQPIVERMFLNHSNTVWVKFSPVKLPNRSQALAFLPTKYQPSVIVDLQHDSIVDTSHIAEVGTRFA